MSMDKYNRDILQADTTITASYVAVGEEIFVGNFDELTLWIDYTNGDETSMETKAVFLYEPGGDEYVEGDWASAAGVRDFTPNEYSHDATGLIPITFDVRGVEYIKFYQKATGGTPDGSVANKYTMTK